MADDKKLWNSLEITKLIASFVTSAAVVGAGFLINSSFRTADEAQAKQLRKTQEIAERQNAVLGFSRFVYERRVRSELLLSSLVRNGVPLTADAKNEIIERKRNYDAAYVNWNTNAQANLLLIRQILGAKSYSSFEGFVEGPLTLQTLVPLDTCLTKAYDLALQGTDPKPLVAQCGARELLARTMNCGYAITDELYQLSDPSQAKSDAEFVVEDRCPSGFQPASIKAQ